MNVKGRLADTAYGLGWAAVRRVPEPMARFTFERIADRIWRKRGRGVLQLEKNLRRVVGDDVSEARLRSLSRHGMRSYFRYWMEAFRLPTMSRERIVDGMRVSGHEKILSNLDSGRGVVLALPHMGNYDHAGAWVTMIGAPFTTVQERLKPESLYDRFVEYRESLGMEILPLTGGGGHVFGTLAQRLRQGRLVCLVADRDLTESGIEVDFFGRTARMPAGPAALAVQTGAALMPVTLWYEGDDWGARVHDEVSVPDAGDRKAKIAEMTQQTAHVFEDGIAAHPQDWHMLQRVWVEDL